MRSDGYLQVTGRSKELYKSGGELVMTKEIEDLLTRHEDISQAFAVGLIDDRWGEIGCAVIVLAPAATLTEDQVLSMCRARFAKFKVPKRGVFWDADDLPKTSTGKVQKYRLKERLGPGPGSSPEPTRRRRDASRSRTPAVDCGARHTYYLF